MKLHVNAIDIDMIFFDVIIIIVTIHKEDKPFSMNLPIFHTVLRKIQTMIIIGLSCALFVSDAMLVVRYLLGRRSDASVRVLFFVQFFSSCQKTNAWFHVTESIFARDKYEDPSASTVLVSIMET